MKIASTMTRLLCALLLVAPAAPLGGQGARSDTTGTGPLVPSTAAWIGGGALLTAAALVFVDGGITEELRDPAPQHNAALHDLAAGSNWLGDPGTVLISVALYGSGRVLHRSAIAELGLRGTEALVISGVATGLIKGIAGRSRPFVTSHDADDFSLGAGFRHAGYSSFPSGHATAAFALASVVASESAIQWPRAARFVRPLAYGAAASVALARVYSNKHWASDVVAGAGIGTVTGLTVVRYHRLHPHGRLDRWLLDTRVFVTDGHGVGLGWSLRAP